jgi:hypothetical protein
MSSSRIGLWVQRNRSDRVEQTGRWHYVDSEVADRIVTRCGREMQLEAKWRYRGLYHPVRNFLNFNAAPWDRYGFRSDSQKCRICATSVSRQSDLSRP